jgi:hypothetical protein
MVAGCWDVSGGQADVNAVLPKIVNGNELDGLVYFDRLYVLRPKDGVVRVGVVLHCPWDEAIPTCAVQHLETLGRAN